MDHTGPWTIESPSGNHFLLFLRSLLLTTQMVFFVCHTNPSSIFFILATNTLLPISEGAGGAGGSNGIIPCSFSVNRHPRSTSGAVSASPTFSLLHHGAGLREGEALHGLIALHPRAVLAGPPAGGELGQHATFEGVALLPRSLAAPGGSVRGCDEKEAGLVKDPEK